MAILLRKLWESVLTRSTSNSSSSTNSVDRFDQMMMYIQTASTGEFDRIPLDIFVQILKVLGPKESAKLSSVCKSWKFIVSDNRLWIYFLQNHHEPWDSTFFAETHLRSGPLRYNRFFFWQLLLNRKLYSVLPKLVVLESQARWLWNVWFNLI